MNTQTAKKRLSSYYTKKGELMANAYKCVEGLKQLQKGESIYPYYWARSREHHTLVERYGRLFEFLKALQIDYKMANDKNGGKESDYIFLTAKGKRQAKEIIISELYKL